MKNRKLNSVTLVIIIITAFMIVVNTGVGMFFTLKSVNDMKELIQGKMLDLACSAALMLDGDELEDLTEDDCINKTQKYVDAYNTLDSFKTSNTRNNAEFAYIYLLRQQDEKTFIFTIDVDPEEPASYGDTTIYTKALAEAGKGNASFDDVAYVDPWGKYYSAYAPVMTTDGKVAAIVACDCNASWYTKEVISNVWSIVIITIVSTVIGIGLALVFNSRMRHRFKTLVKETNDLQEDVDSLINEIKMPEEFLIKNEDEPNETVEQGDQIIELRSRVRIMQKEIRQYLEYTKALAYIDALTGMGNRTAYVNRVKEFDTNMNNETQLAIVVFDINGLKRINDTYGHEIGDKSIIESSTRIKNVFGSKVCYRIGGDEMTVIIETNNADYVKELIERFDANMKAFNDRKELPFELGLSKGYAIYDSNLDKSFDDIFNRADGSMYQEKNEFYGVDDTK